MSSRWICVRSRGNAVKPRRGSSSYFSRFGKWTIHSGNASCGGSHPFRAPQRVDRERSVQARDFGDHRHAVAGHDERIGVCEQSEVRILRWHPRAIRTADRVRRMRSRNAATAAGGVRLLVRDVQRPVRAAIRSREIDQFASGCGIEYERLRCAADQHRDQRMRAFVEMRLPLRRFLRPSRSWSMRINGSDTLTTFGASGT